MQIPTRRNAIGLQGEASVIMDYLDEWRNVSLVLLIHSGDLVICHNDGASLLRLETWACIAILAEMSPRYACRCKDRFLFTCKIDQRVYYGKRMVFKHLQVQKKKEVGSMGQRKMRVFTLQLESGMCRLN